MSNKILIICGLTASGKTSLALQVAKACQPASLINLDSRQAYQDLPILTGQDIPAFFSRHTSKKITYLRQPAVYFSHHHVNIWGVDQLPPDQPLNLADFTDFAWRVVRSEQQANRSIILVGGTGLYLKAFIEPLTNIHAQYNPALRNRLGRLSVSSLQTKLNRLDPAKFNSMNHSDRHNPRRLIRAIEVASSPKAKTPRYHRFQNQANFRLVGLTSNQSKLKQKITSRVIKRIKAGVMAEISALSKNYPDPSLPIYSSLGVDLIRQYQLQKISQAKLVASWVAQELAYAKRQKVWFKKQDKIIWYDQDITKNKLANKLSSWLKT